jgi:hypothetical protein
MRAKQKLFTVCAAGLLLFGLAACDVEKQMDTMVDNPSFAEPLFTKFLAKPEYQAKAMDLILGDPAMRQTLLEKVMANPEWARSAANQLMSSTELRNMVGQMLTNPPTEDVQPPATP